jgi:hypothetical protein
LNFFGKIKGMREKSGKETNLPPSGTPPLGFADGLSPIRYPASEDLSPARQVTFPESHNNGGQLILLELFRCTQLPAIAYSFVQVTLVTGPREAPCAISKAGHSDDRQDLFGRSLL